MVVRDPYRTLNVPHSATLGEIKQAFRTLALQHHPDRQRANNNIAPRTTSTTIEDSTQTFAQVAEAYALLSDSRRKAQYDHVYKYGGYDHHDDTYQQDEEEKKEDTFFDRTRRRDSTTSYDPEKSMGIGYSCHDPFLSFLFSQGKVQSTQTVAGIQIPKRFDLQNGRRGSFRVAISSGQRFARDPQTGTQAFRSQTTQFTDGHRFTRSETVVVHPNGRKEGVVVDNHTNNGGSSQTRHYVIDPPSVVPQNSRSQAASAAQNKTAPWYVQLWGELKHSLTMCQG